jgi:exopolysaccharide production protein ExoY
LGAISHSAWRVLPGRARRLRRAGGCLWKRPLDVSLAVILLAIAIPLMLALVAAIFLQDRGPVLFRHSRLGRHGRRFNCLKFRTMGRGAEERLRDDREFYERYRRNNFKLPPNDDPRVTRFGQLLRKTSLDELPQLINVIKGDMSLVGPRPIIERELEEYRSRGCEDAYLSARPGLTGLWQVSGRSDVGYDQRVEYDRSYLSNPTIAADIKIIARTVPAVLAQRGAH